MIDDFQRLDIVTDLCLVCGEPLDYDEVDIGVGVQRGNPRCQACDDRQSEVGRLLDTIQSEMIDQAKDTMRSGTTLAPIAVVIGSGHRIVVIALLDLSQRVGVLQEALTEYGGTGFFLLHDGFVLLPAPDGTKEQRDALLMVRMTAHESASVALPYRANLLAGTTFDAMIEAPEAPVEYRSIRFPPPHLPG